MSVSGTRQLENQKQNEGCCTMLVWKEKRLKVLEVHQLLDMYCVLYITEPSVVKVTRKDTSVWKREGQEASYSVNNVEQCSVANVINGSGVREE